MSEKNKRALIKLIWSRLPKWECKRKCQASCRAWFCTGVEWRMIVEKGGERRAESFFDPCPYLNERGLCDVYEVRPTICRLWGCVESMRCPYGCKPSKILTDEQGAKVLKLVSDVDRGRVSTEEQVLRRLEAIGL